MICLEFLLVMLLLISAPLEIFLWIRKKIADHREHKFFSETFRVDRRRYDA